MTSETILVTGFEPFGGEDVNPSGEVARVLDGKTVASLPVAGRVLPVNLAAVPSLLDEFVREIDPAVILNLGLAAGEPVIRLERVAVNIADFDIPDNTGHIARDAGLVEDGPLALPSRLPLRAAENALLAAGIPARISNTAGLYLCNVTMYTVLARYPNIPAGFVHLPYLPEEVAALLARAQAARSVDVRLPASLASMSLDAMVRATHVILETTIAACGKSVSAEPVLEGSGAR